MSRLSIKNNPLVLAVLAGACLLGNAAAGAAELQGSALRPTPLLMPLDYTAARAQAWLAALDKALEHLPPAANRRLEDLGLDKASVGGTSALRSLAAGLFPVDVVTPQISSGQEIRVYLKKPENFTAFSRLAGDADTIAINALIILEMEDEIAALGEAWPKSIDEARVKTAELEGHASALDTLWQIRQTLASGQEYDSADLASLAKAAPQSPLVRLLLAEALLEENMPGECVEQADAALDLGLSLAGEQSSVWKFLRPRLRYARAIAQWRLNHLALAENDLDAALLEAKNLPPKNGIKILDARGILKMQRRDLAGMCADFAQACSLGNCQSLARARRMGQCGQ